MLFVVQLFYSETLEQMGEYLLQDFKDDPKMELIFVMVILPFTLNSIQVSPHRNYHDVTSYFIVLDLR